MRYAHDDEVLIGVIEEDERAHGGIRPTAQTLYAAVRRFQEQSRIPATAAHVELPDAINEGEGDAERYRQFCVGRALGLGSPKEQALPAATAIGRQQQTHQLQVFWVAARAGGTAIENPRQVSAYHYPREHGPVSPSFSRAMVAPDRTCSSPARRASSGTSRSTQGDARAQLRRDLPISPLPRRMPACHREATRLARDLAEGLRARSRRCADDRRSAAAGSASGRDADVPGRRCLPPRAAARNRMHTMSGL